MTHPLLSRVREDILALQPYPSARFLTQADAAQIHLDANELPYPAIPGRPDYGRYAGQQPPALTKALAGLYNVPPEQLLVCRGADEAIDILVRTFCKAYRDAVMIASPAFPMYAMSASWQGVQVIDVPLTAVFQLDVDAMLQAVTPATKLVFVTTPNNPTGNSLQTSAIKSLAEKLANQCLIVVDETYIDFTDDPSFASLLNVYPNICVLRTLSKSHGLAGVRCGVMILDRNLRDQCAKVLPPYPLPVPVTDTVLTALRPANIARLADRRRAVLQTRDRFVTALAGCPGLQHIHPSNANFILTTWDDADAVMLRAKQAGFVLRRVKDQHLVTGGIRISIGTDREMDLLLAALWQKEHVATGKHRFADVIRSTKETAISCKVDLDAAEPVDIRTGVGFYDHMLDQVAKHGGFSLEMVCLGDLHIDAHHTVEDCAIALGQALKMALGDKAGIGRYGFTVPMDESLAHVAIDLSGRPYLVFKADFPATHVGDLPTDMVEHVFRSLADALGANIHVTVTGENAHHMVEACFKGLGRALRQAIKVEGDALPSTKGLL